MSIGILALQGNVDKHQQALTALGVSSTCVTLPEHLAGLSGLIMPGGETTAMLKLMAPYDFMSAIKSFHAQGGAILGICAGAILLAKGVTPQQSSLGLIDIDIKRNAYGRQLDSFTAITRECNPKLKVSELPLVFIRAPKIHRVGQECQILACYQEEPIWVAQENLMAATFHPEMTQDQTVLKRFLKMAKMDTSV